MTVSNPEPQYWKPTWQFRTADADRLAAIVEADGFAGLARGIREAATLHHDRAGIQFATMLVNEQQALEQAMRVVYPNMSDEPTKGPRFGNDWSR